jgi:Ca-activated chloride channel family protein
MIISMAGPCWIKLPVVTYKSIQPKVLVLDMSKAMMATDLTPNRLARAKFKLHDLFTHKEAGQFGLVVFTSEPFVVSPLTDDGQTISALLSSLNPEVMPVSGQNLADALNEASGLIHQAGFKQGQLLILTADSPSAAASNQAKKLAETGILSSIMPIRADSNLNPLFKKFAEAGQGQLVKYSADSKDIETWLQSGSQDDYVMNKDDEIPLWRDEGRWFLIPALLLLLPLFQRGRLQRMAV